jgi:dTDP-4-dehydrorhamnose 3,5-epimerase
MRLEKSIRDTIFIKLMQRHISTFLAHGFITVSETTGFLYKTTDYYAPQYERCIAWNDPEIGINWPITETPKLSLKDQCGISLTTNLHVEL